MKEEPITLKYILQSTFAFIILFVTIILLASLY